MPEYIFKGKLTLDGVNFYITADNEKAAKEKARNGDFDDLEILGASSSDREIDPDSIELNE